MEILIEKNVPIPKGAWYGYLLRMAPPDKNGNPKDSFVFPAGEFGAVRRQVMNLRKKFPRWRFKTMRISETDRRIWRIK